MKRKQVKHANYTNIKILLLLYLLKTFDKKHQTQTKTTHNQTSGNEANIVWR